MCFAWIKNTTERCGADAFGLNLWQDESRNADENVLAWRTSVSPSSSSTDAVYISRNVFWKVVHAHLNDYMVYKDDEKPKAGALGLEQDESHN